MGISNDIPHEKKVFLMGTDNIIGYKLFVVLKRSYDVSFLSRSGSHDNTYKIDSNPLLDKEVKSSDYVIWTYDCNESNQWLEYSYFYELSRSENIKMVTIVPMELVEPTIKMLEDLNYFKQQVMQMDNSNSLLMLIPPVIGCCDWNKDYDFSSIDSKYSFADEIALDIVSQIESFGIVNISSFPISSDVLSVISKQKRCSFELVYRLSPLSYFLGENVATARIKMGNLLSKVVLNSVNIDEIDYVVPVPNTGIYYGIGLSIGINKPYVQALVKTALITRTYDKIDPNVRKRELKTKIHPIKELIKGKNLLIIDEAIFTGTTLKIVVSMLHEAGVNSVVVAVPTPRCRSHCNNYIQPSRTMLLEYVSEDMLPDYFNVDKVIFQQDEVFSELLKDLGGCCADCFLGERKE